jgi:alkanesulfonate monooxygenase SsuD/methylene tetrahydromethanopterin reductase-like flavin-dependent oxidoreductase (luciferase family)
MSDYGRELAFGANVDPDAARLTEARAIARLADTSGLDLISVQDHPYQERFVDAFALIATVLAETGRARVFPNVANLPLRPPAMIAKAAASLDLISRGRFELGLGAGAFWEGIGAMGGPVRSPGESVDALAEAIALIRLFWSGERPVTFEGAHYAVHGLHPGPPSAHPIGIWLGALKPRMLALTGRVADGWTVSLPYLPPERVPPAAARLDEAAAAAGRDPAAIRRIYNVMAELDDPTALTESIVRFALELGFDTFVLWPAGEDRLGQVARFAEEVVPAVREAVARARA